MSTKDASRDQTGTRPFVGRAPELHRLGAALEAARAGRGTLWLAAGEPGIGKTRLADEVTAIAADAGARTFWGRCWEAGGAPAYWPWLDALAEMARGLPTDALREALGADVRFLDPLVPDLAARLPGPIAVAPPSADEGRFRLWRAATAVVRRAAEPGGLLLVLDDLHAADLSSLHLLRFLARDLRTSRVMVLGTYRDVEARHRPDADALLAQIAREGETLTLSRLARDTTLALLASRAGALDAPTAARMFDRTQGNPLFAEQMLQLWIEQGDEAVLGAALPHGVRGAIRQRLDRTSAEVRALLEIAAVAGDELDPVWLADATGGAAVAPALSEAVAADLVVERSGRRRFSHALVREVLYADMDEATRTAHHEALAAALERRRGTDAEAPLAKLAHHALAAVAGRPADGRGLSRAVQLTVEAAHRALAAVGYDEAVALLEDAVAAVHAHGDPPGPRAVVLLALGEARIRRGEGQKGQAACREAAAIARQTGDADLLARAALTYGRVFAFAVVDPVLVQLLEEALEALPPGDSALRARVLARLGGALQPAPHAAEPAAIAREAIATARRLEDPIVLLETLHDALSALMDVAPPAERCALNLEAEQLAIATGDRERLLRAHLRLAIDLLALRDLPGAQARIDAFDELARELAAPWHRYRAPIFRSLRASMEGRFAEAERHMEAAREIAAPVMDAQTERLLALHRQAFLRHGERHEELSAHHPLVTRLCAGLRFSAAWTASMAALMFTRIEDDAQTRLHLERVPRDLRPPVDNLFAIFFCAEPVAFVGEAAEIQRFYDVLLPFADEDVLLGLTQMSWEGPVSRLLALLAARLGRLDEAVARFEDATARSLSLGARPLLARTRYEHGRTLLLGGARAAGRALVEAALSDAEALGMPGLVTLARRRLGDDPPAAAPAEARTASDLARLVREGEVWSVTHAGRTFRLKDSLGLRYLARLMETPGHEVHVLELAGGPEAGGAVADAGDAGELLDEEARTTYRRRLAELDEDLDEAGRFADVGRLARLREERDSLTAELERAVGLGGRVRRAGGAAERARSAVQRRIKNALERIAEHDPALAAGLARAVRTGNFCVYRAV